MICAASMAFPQTSWLRCRAGAYAAVAAPAGDSYNTPPGQIADGTLDEDRDTGLSDGSVLLEWPFLNRPSGYSVAAGPNRTLREAAAQTGTRLDAGCGESTDGLWLASRACRPLRSTLVVSAAHRACQHAEYAGIRRGS
jgi:hypothetical protein